MADWPGIYNAGTATVAANGTTVTFQSAGNIAQAVRPGDRFGAHKGLGIRIAAISGNTATLAQPWPGAAQTAAPYEIAFTPFDSGYRQALQTLIDTIGGGNTGALNALILAANQLLYVNDSGALDQASLTAFARSLMDDADASTALSTLGISAYAKTLLDDADASTAQSTLGISDFIKTLLDDADDVAARTSLGANNAANLSTGTIPDARISATLSQDKAFRRGNILGTLAQSAGVPTGALIEKGANANGSYTRFADGTQFCWRAGGGISIASAAGSLFVNGAAMGPYPWPAAFVGSPHEFVTSHKIDGAAAHSWAASVTRATATQTSAVQLFRISSDADGYFPEFLGIGRWY